MITPKRHNTAEEYPIATLLKRLRQQPFPEQTLFPTLLRLVVEWLRLPQVFLALDATMLGSRWKVLALGVGVHQPAIPIAGRVVRGTAKGARLPSGKALLGVLRGALPKSIPVCGPIGAYGRRRCLPPSCAMDGICGGRVNAQGNFRPLGVVGVCVGVSVARAQDWFMEQALVAVLGYCCWD